MGVLPECAPSPQKALETSWKALGLSEKEAPSLSSTSHILEFGAFFVTNLTGITKQNNKKKVLHLILKKKSQNKIYLCKENEKSQTFT